MKIVKTTLSNHSILKASGKEYDWQYARECREPLATNSVARIEMMSESAVRKPRQPEH